MAQTGEALLSPLLLALALGELQPDIYNIVTSSSIFKAEPIIRC